ncbi:MAG: hypothetical protein ACOVO3_05070 [Fluviicola sp.]|jgi:outer membrane protein W
MKKLSLLVGGLALSTLALAQKPSADVPFTLEGQLGWNASTLSFDAPSIRFRYFLQDNLAVRATVLVDNDSETINHYELPNNAGGVGTEINKSSDWALAVGAEYHFAGTDKLSPYAGLDIVFGGGNNRAEWDKYDGSSYAADVTASVTSPTSMIGVNLVAGTDYYFAENFYVGLELGLGWMSQTTKEGVTTVTVAGTTTETKTPDSKESYMGNNVVGQFRLGWRF